MEPPHCRLLPFQVADGAWNMAADETLLESAAAGIASFRLYAWSQPTLSLGYFQAHEPSRAFPRLNELAWVRRPSGGAALIHHHEVTYALGLPAGSPWHKRGESWLRRLHAVLTQALRDLGVSVHACGDEEETKRGEVLCFLHHTPGDLLVGENKVVGSAQRKQRGALLQHGSILLAVSPYTPMIPGLNELTGSTISSESFCAVTVDALRRNTGWKLQARQWSPGEQQRIEQLVADKYSQPDWNCKR
jgi:lipoate-protein ligase A